MKKSFLLFFIIFSAIIFFFFKPFIFFNQLPIPSDTIIGLYHPFRDLYAKEFPRGITYKNFLITDPVRQQYPWKELVISLEKKMQLPLWNPYNFSGTPLLGNYQSAPFYPLNIVLFLLPFSLSWSLLVVLQPFLAGIFMYLFLQNHKLSKQASFFGAFVFAFCGFSIAWLEWNTILHTALWLPLLLLSVDKILIHSSTEENSKFKIQKSKIQIKIKKKLLWSCIFIFSVASSVLAGHLQTAFYFNVISCMYVLTRLYQQSVQEKRTNIVASILKKTVLFLLLTIPILIFTAVQIVPTLQFISLSARDIDQSFWQQPGWFIPWQHMAQFIAPDFFGNPTTLNYWGIWNYGEFAGYIGIAPLLFALFALFFRRDRKTLFFGTLFFTALLFSFPTFLAKIPFQLSIPFLSTAQPTRLLFIVDFALAVMCALGLDLFLRSKKGILFPLGFLLICIALLWGVVLYGQKIFPSVSLQNLQVAHNNLYFPTLIFTGLTFLVAVSLYYKKNAAFKSIFPYLLILLTIVDLFRFGLKFTPFTNPEYLFPSTKTISFLQQNIKNHRIMSINSELLPPNFTAVYRLQSIEGYDPLYLRRYAEFISASERGTPDITPPFGFNRIITPHRYDSPLIDLLGVKYILSLSDISSPKLKKVFQEGETRIYENTAALPRAFFVENTRYVTTQQEAINTLFDKAFNINTDAVVEYSINSEVNSLPTEWKKAAATIEEYSENKVVIKTSSDKAGFLVLTDSFYPNWHAKIYTEGNDPVETKIFRTDYNFRGIVVPEGVHIVEFYISLF